MNGQVSFEATSVKIEPLRGGKMFVDADFFDTDDFLESLSISSDINILDCMSEEHIVKYLEDKGYYVTHEKDRA